MPLDSRTEGVIAAIAKAHGVYPKKAHRWHEEGMPADIAEAEEWLKTKRRGRYGKQGGNPDSDRQRQTEESALAAAIKRGDASRPGVLGMLHRAEAVERAAYDLAKREPSASNVNAHARAQEAVVEATEAVAKFEERCANLMETTSVKRAIQAQDGACVSLGTAMPYSVADLLVDQPREVIIEVLQNWWTHTFFAKRRETDPFRDGAAELVDIGEVIAEAEEEAGEGEDE